MNRRTLALVMMIGLSSAASTHSDAQQIFWVGSTLAGPTILTCNTDGSGLTGKDLPKEALPQGLAFAPSNENLYWGARNFPGPALYWSTTALSAIDTLTGSGSAGAVRGTAVDAGAGLFYWTSSDQRKGNAILRAPLGTAKIETLLSLPPRGLNNLRGIALYLPKGKLYWADVGTGTISSADLDGRNAEVILKGLAGPTGIAIDSSAEKFYWTESASGRILRANLDGSSADTLVTGLNSVQYLAIDVDNKLLVWTEVGTNGNGRVATAPMTGGEPVTLVKSFNDVTLRFPSGIAFWPNGHATGIDAGSAPLRFRLEQNFPNPFNPSTTIRYEVEKTGQVRLAVYDLLGRQVALVVDGTVSAGGHSAVFNGAGLASGTYLYRLSAGTTVASGRMLLVK